MALGEAIKDMDDSLKENITTATCAGVKGGMALGEAIKDMDDSLKENFKTATVAGVKGGMALGESVANFFKGLFGKE